MTRCSAVAEELAAVQHVSVFFLFPSLQINASVFSPSGLSCSCLCVSVSTISVHNGHLQTRLAGAALHLWEAKSWCSLLAQARRPALPCPTGSWSEPACCDTWDALLLAEFTQPHCALVQMPSFAHTTTMSFWSVVSLPFSLQGDKNGSLLCCPIEPPCPIPLIFTHLGVLYGSTLALVLYSPPQTLFVCFSLSHICSFSLFKHEAQVWLWCPLWKEPGEEDLRQLQDCGLCRGAMLLQLCTLTIKRQNCFAASSAFLHLCPSGSHSQHCSSNLRPQPHWSEHWAKTKQEATSPQGTCSLKGRGQEAAGAKGVPESCTDDEKLSPQTSQITD